MVVLLALAGGGWYYLQNSKPAQIEWRTSHVEFGSVKVVVTATGSLNPDTTVAVGTQVSGLVAALFTDFNKTVKRHQLIAVLDTTPLVQTVTDSRAALAKTRATMDLDKANLDRERALFTQKLVAQSDLDASIAAYNGAVADDVSAQAQLDKALTNLGYAYIHSPIEGVVLARNVDVGQTVASSFSTPTLFSIANTLTKMQVWASVDEADIGNVKKDQTVDFTVDAYPNNVFHGTVAQIRLNYVTSANVVDYTVIVDVSNEDLKLLPGMTANLTVNVDEHDSVLKVPTAALRFVPPREYLEKYKASLPDSVKAKIQSRMNRGGGDGTNGGNGGFGGGQGGQQGGRGRDLTPGSYARVWIKEGDSLKAVRVQIGLSDGSYTEVHGDLQPGAEVVMGVIASDAASAATQGNQQTPFQMRRF